MAKQIALEDEDVIEFRTDDEYLIDGMVPEFVENCTHQDMEDMPPNEFYMTACKHCGQLIPNYR